jgi:glycosyltransferase involved in cell wall biosynthesis
MHPVVFVVPGPIATRTGGFIYDRRMAEGLREHGWTVDVLELDAGFPDPVPGMAAAAGEALARLRGRTIAIVDGLALPGLSEVVARESRRLRIVALVHLPLAADVTIDAELAARLGSAECRALRAASLVVATGSAALPLLARYGLQAERVVVVEPGTDAAPLATGSGEGALNLLSAATLGPGKGHEILLTALSTVRSRAWRLFCAGSLTRHPATAERVRAAVHDLGLDDRVTLLGDIDRPALDEEYARADLFVSASLQETYGMAVAEALARGLPVVATATGAVPGLLEGGGGLVVPPGDPRALARALARVIDDPDLRASLAAGARRVRNRLPGWRSAAAKMSAALEALAAR